MYSQKPYSALYLLPFLHVSPGDNYFHHILVYPFDVSAFLSDIIFPYFLFVLIQTAEYYELFCNLLFLHLTINPGNYSISVQRPESENPHNWKFLRGHLSPNFIPHMTLNQKSIKEINSHLENLGYGGSKVYFLIRLTIRFRELYQKVLSHAELTSNSEKLHSSATCSHKELAGSLFHHAALET